MEHAQLVALPWTFPNAWLRVGVPEGLGPVAQWPNDGKGSLVAASGVPTVPRNSG